MSIIRDHHRLICTTNDKGLDGGDTASNEGFYRGMCAALDISTDAHSLSPMDLSKKLTTPSSEGIRHPDHGPQEGWGWNDTKKFSRHQELPIVMWIMILSAQITAHMHKPWSTVRHQGTGYWTDIVEHWCTDRGKGLTYQNGDLCLPEIFWLHPRLFLKHTALVWIGDFAILFDAIMLTRLGFRWDHDKKVIWKFTRMKADHTSDDKTMIMSLIIADLYGPWSPVAWLARQIYLRYRMHMTPEQAIRSYFRAESGNSPEIGELGAMAIQICLRQRRRVHDRQIGILL